MSRYNKSRLFTNESSLVRARGKSSIRHHGTQILYHPTAEERSRIPTNKYIWKPGDRLFNVAYAFYGDPTLWWVIAWYNGRPTEADFYPGDYIEIPIDIEKTLNVLEV
jgi:nucleoid-associated protein YgaU